MHQTNFFKHKMKPHQTWVVSAHENGEDIYSFAFTVYKDAEMIFKEGKRRYRKLTWLIQLSPLDTLERAKYHLDGLKFRKNWD